MPPKRRGPPTMPTRRTPGKRLSRAASVASTNAVARPPSTPRASSTSAPPSRRTVQLTDFGAESAVLLHMVSQVKPDMPVLFLDTGMLFGQTLDYRRQLAARLGLTGVRATRPTTLAHTFTLNVCACRMSACWARR